MGANITIYDNLSTDRSKEIILSSGCTYIPYDSGGQIRDDLYLKIKNNAWKGSKADFCIIVDIDEFLEVPSDLEDCTMVRTKGYDIVGPPPSRNGVFNPMYSKFCMFRPDQIKEINFSPGCHNCSPSGNIKVSTQTANLLHYKYISEEYVYARHKVYQGRISDINRTYQWGIEYFDPKREEIDKKFAELRDSAIIIL